MSKVNITFRIIAFICLLTASFDCNGKTIKEYVSSDNTLLISITDNDSLYIDCYESGCGIVAYSLKPKKESIGDNVYVGTYYDYEIDYLNPQKKREIIEIKRLDKKGNYLISFNDREKIRIKEMTL